MPLSTPDILRLVGDISEEENIKIAFTESLKGGAVTGVSTVIGGILLGPIGLALGGILGGVSSYFVSQGKFESVPVVLMKLEQSKKELLADKVRTFLISISRGGLPDITKMKSSPDLRLTLVKLIIEVLICILPFVYKSIKTKPIKLEHHDDSNNVESDNQI